MALPFMFDPISFSSAVGLLAAALTSLSYIPQLRKAWPRGKTEDVSLKMLIVLCSGLALWIIYGVCQGTGSSQLPTSWACSGRRRTGLQGSRFAIRMSGGNFGLSKRSATAVTTPMMGKISVI